MQKNKKLIIGGILIGITLIIAYTYRRSLIIGSKKFKRKLSNLAESEWNAWNASGKIKEGSPQTMDRLRKYWEEGAGVKQSDSYYVNEAWSAAFISYVMRKSGAKDTFPYSHSHSNYIVKSIKNRKTDSDNPFKGYKPSEVKVEVGDLVCYPRQAGVTYDSTGNYYSHCDIVTEIDKDKAVSIGGNVSNSVTKTMVPLKDGKIDKSKDKQGFGGYFVVIKNQKK